MAEFNKSAKMLAIEKRLGGRPLERAILEMVNEQGLSGAARELGLSKATLNYWLLKFGIRTRRIFLGPGDSYEIRRTSD